MGHDRRPICATISATFRPQTTRTSAPTSAPDNHGVSDPSGHTRGNFQRAHRGRSRHVSCSDRGTSACAVGGKERRPSCWCRVFTVEVAARESVTGGAGRSSVARAVPFGRQASNAPGDNLNFRGRPPGRPLIEIRRRQPRGRDAGTVARTRCIQFVRVHGRWRRPR